jgi:hypothetical protein
MHWSNEQKKALERTRMNNIHVHPRAYVNTNSTFKMKADLTTAMLTGQSSINSVIFNLTTSINVLTHHENTTNKT